MSDQFVVMKAGADHKVDYNADGKIDSKDDIVVHYKNGKNVGWRLLNETVKRRLSAIIKKDATVLGPKKRVVYERAPAGEVAPVVIKEGTDFGQYVKAGAGHQLGQETISLAFDTLGSMFSDEGGGGRGRPHR